MKYFNTPLEEQETLVNILYEEQLIRIYSNNVDVIKNLTQKIGEPTKKIKRSKAYWAAASWDVDFSNVEIVNKILSKEVFIDENIIYTKKKIKLKGNEKNKEKYYQLTFDNI